MYMNEHSKLNRPSESPQAAGIWLAAVYASFFAWLFHGFAFRAFLASLRELVGKFLTKS